jgi:hypothetical protein
MSPTTLAPTAQPTKMPHDFFFEENDAPGV